MSFSLPVPFSFNMYGLMESPHGKHMADDCAEWQHRPLPSRQLSELQQFACPRASTNFATSMFSDPTQSPSKSANACCALSFHICPGRQPPFSAFSPTRKRRIDPIYYLEAEDEGRGWAHHYLPVLLLSGQSKYYGKR